jgi:hypothetical protein
MFEITPHRSGHTSAVAKSRLIPGRLVAIPGRKCRDSGKSHPLAIKGKEVFHTIGPFCLYADNGWGFPDSPGTTLTQPGQGSIRLHCGGLIPGSGRAASHQCVVVIILRIGATESARAEARG